MGVVAIPESVKWHPQWPGYGCDPEGNIYSQMPGRRPRLLKPWIKDCGHACVSLRRDGRTEKVLVHRFVLEVFIGPCPDGMEGCHGEEGPAVNALRNIRWDTHQENHRDRFRHGQPYGKQKLTPTDVDEIKRLRASGEKLRVIATRFGVTEANICAIARGKTWGILA